MVNETEKNGKTTLHKVYSVIGIVLCVILIPILIVNCTMLVKSFIYKDEAPSLFNVTPLIVLTESMDPTICSGDLIITKKIDAGEVKAGDIISFYDPAGNGTSIVTHRVQEIVTNEDGTRSFITKGDANNTEDKKPVPAEKLVGLYKFSFAGLGSVAMFMQTIPGLLICVLVPLLLLIGYDVIRRRMYEKKHTDDTNALLAELEALRAEKAKAEQNGTDNKDCDNQSE